MILPSFPREGSKHFCRSVDSAKLVVCHNVRIRGNRVFQGLIQRGRTAMGWFFGFKRHLPIHHQGQIMAFKITGSNTDDPQPLQSMTGCSTGQGIWQYWRLIPYLELGLEN